MEIDLDELKRLALAATPGPWKWWTSNSELRLTGADQKDGGVLHAYKHSTWADISCSAANQDFIAAANPAVILELVAKIDRLQARLEVDPRCNYDGIDCRDVTIKYQDERIATLEAENERLKRTEAHITGLHVTTLADWQKLKAENEALKKDAARATSSPETSAPSRPEECQSPGKTVRSAK